MVLEADPITIFYHAMKGIGFMIGGASLGIAGALTLFNQLKRFIGQSNFQVDAGTAIKTTLKTQEETKVILNSIKNHMDQEKEVLKDLLEYSKENAKNSAIMNVLLETYITRN